MAATAIINGVNYSWGNLSVVLFGTVIIGITKITYNAKQNKTNNYGLGNKPISRGYGNYEFEGSMELYLDEWKRIIDTSPLRDPLQLLPSDIQIVFAGQRVLPGGDSLLSVEFLENPLEANQGDTKLMVTIPLLIGDILR